MKAYKIFTHDLRSPIQGGDPVWGGDLPYRLPEVEVDISLEDCSKGWYACLDLPTALKIGGLWPDGWSSRTYVVNTEDKITRREEKVKASWWDIERECTLKEISEAIYKLSKPFKKHVKRMVKSQLVWREALRRPFYDPKKVEKGLYEALKIRELDWNLRKFDFTNKSQEFEYANNEINAYNAWEGRIVRECWKGRDIRVAKDAWDSWGAWVKDAWDVWAVRDALTIEYSALRGWVKRDPTLLTVGLQGAYKHGLAIALPTGPKELGWAMIKEMNK